MADLTRLWVCQNNGVEFCTPSLPHITDVLPPQARKCGYVMVDWLKERPKQQEPAEQ